MIRDRHGRADPDCAAEMLRTIRLDVGLAIERRIPIIWRRLLTAVPALILLALGLEPTRLLILFQVILSFGIPFGLVPLVRIAADPELMHLVPTRRATIAVAWLVSGIVTTLNVILIVLTAAGV